VTGSALLIVSSTFQAAVMGVDELYFHRKRGLGRWERIGHPIDTLSVVACLVWVLTVPPSGPAAFGFITLSVFSCLLITKDEWVHARRCSAGEHWVHALLFLVHPVTLATLGLLWPLLHAASGAPISWITADRFLFVAVAGQLVVTIAFCAYQIVYWNLPWRRRESPGR